MASIEDALPSYKADTLTPGQTPAAGRAVKRSPQRLSSCRLIFCFFTSLLIFSALHKPASRCYALLADRVCEKAMTVEQRARRILAHNPLIGKLCYYVSSGLVSSRLVSPSFFLSSPLQLIEFMLEE